MANPPVNKKTPVQVSFLQAAEIGIRQSHERGGRENAMSLRPGHERPGSFGEKSLREQEETPLQVSLLQVAGLGFEPRTFRL